MQVKTFKFPDFPKDQINEFLDLIENKLIYYSVEYNELLVSALSNSECYCICVLQKKSILGLFWFHIYENDKGVKVANSLPFFGGHGGSIVLPNSDYKLCVENLLIGKFLAICGENGVASCLIVENLHEASNDELYTRHGFEKVERRIGQITMLPSQSTSSEVGKLLFANFHVKTRNAIRKGLNYEQDITLDNSRKAWDWLEQEHWNSIVALGGVPKSSQVFESIRSSKIEHRLYVGRGREGISSALLILLFNKTVEYFTPVSLPSLRNQQVLPSLIFTVMKELSMEGFEYWNWGGTWESQTGVYRFKKRFGAVDFPYRYFGKIFSTELLEIEPQTLRDKFPYYYVRKY